MLKAMMCVAVMCLSLGSAHADFVPTDWQTVGDQKAVLDSDTGIEWLTLDETQGKSVSQIVGLLETTFAGWRLPTADEYHTMVSNFFGFSPSVGSLSALEMTAWQNTFGFSSSTTHSVGWLALGTANGNVVQTGVRSNYVYYTYANNSYYTSPVSWISVWLVSDGGTTLSSLNDPSLNINNPNAPINVADVSTPAGLAAAGVLIFMLGARSRKAKGITHV